MVVVSRNAIVSRDLQEHLFGPKCAVISVHFGVREWQDFVSRGRHSLYESVRGHPAVPRGFVEETSMTRVLVLLLGAVMVSSGAGAQSAAGTPADTAAYAVSYVEVMAASKAPAIAALKQYREACRKSDGYLHVELFEQVGRPGHFAIVETWRDQKALDAHGPAQKQLLDALEPIRVSGYDERPYKTLTVGIVPAPNSRAVSVVSHVDVTPDPRVAEMLKRLAEASRKEDGSVRFDVIQHTMRANHFTVVETWQNQKAFDAHLAAAHTKQYRDELQPLTGSPLDERVYTAIE